MKSAIIDGRRRDVVIREITDAELHAVTVTLARCGIRIKPVIDAEHTVHLWAKGPVGLHDELAAIGAFHDLTDARVDWHEATA